jgi:hypothetical protein
MTKAGQVNAAGQAEPAGKTRPASNLEILLDAELELAETALEQAEATACMLRLIQDDQRFRRVIIRIRDLRSKVKGLRAWQAQ